MTPHAQELYSKTLQFYIAVYQDIQGYREETSRLNSIQDQADLAYVVREIEKLLDDIRKEVGKLERQSHMLSAVLWLKDPTQLNENLWIETDYCKAKPKIEKSPVLPKFKSEPEEYAKMMRFFGVKEEHIPLDILRVHWKNMKEFINGRLVEGYSTPPGIDPDKLFTDYTLSIRKKKGILDDNETAES